MMPSSLHNYRNGNISRKEALFVCFIYIVILKLGTHARAANSRIVRCKLGPYNTWLMRMQQLEMNGELLHRLQVYSFKANQ